jgi:hypothetical protein
MAAARAQVSIFAARESEGEPIKIYVCVAMAQGNMALRKRGSRAAVANSSSMGWQPTDSNVWSCMRPSCRGVELLKEGRVSNIGPSHTDHADRLRDLD